MDFGGDLIMTVLSTKIDSVPIRLTEFAHCYRRSQKHPESNKSFNDHIKDLASLALDEYWGATKNGIENPILHNYIKYTFQKIAVEFNTASTQEEKLRKINFNDDFACINTGLFTKQYEPIFMVFRRNRIPNKEPFYLLGFFKESHHILSQFGNLPDRASYFNDASELIFDYRLPIRVDKHHILVERKDRLPLEFRSDEKYNLLLNTFDGAVYRVQKRVAANYKLAVPQYYWANQTQGCMQLLLPLSLTGDEPELALAIQKNGKVYEARTCLTLEMAYNNARLIVRPESDWLKP